MDLLESMHRGGLTLVVVTHDAAIAGRARRVIQMDDGRVVRDGA
jgi:putative ABC transport system ATP-binding protein